MRSGTFSSRCSGRTQCQLCFHFMFDLGSYESVDSEEVKDAQDTLVTAVPERKNTQSNAKNMLQGCRA